MALIDFIWNLACLLLWLNWRSVHFDPLGERRPATLIGTLRPAEPQPLRRWYMPLAIAGLLLLRAAIYFVVGSAAKPVWSGILNLGVTAPAFSSNSFFRMLLFSGLSFGKMVGVFYLWLLLLSLLAPQNHQPFHRWIQMPLGTVDRWPRWAKLLLPFTVTAVLWWLLSWLLVWQSVIPGPVTSAGRIQAAVLMGLESYLVWKYAAGVLLALHLLNSYIYFGKHPLWPYINAEAQTMLSPFRRFPLRLDKVDFAPVVEIALIFFLAGCAQDGLKLPWFKIPGLEDVYEKLPF